MRGRLISMMVLSGTVFAGISLPSLADQQSAPVAVATLFASPVEAFPSEAPRATIAPTNEWLPERISIGAIRPTRSAQVSPAAAQPVNSMPNVQTQQAPKRPTASPEKHHKAATIVRLARSRPAIQRVASACSASMLCPGAPLLGIGY